ncbi:MAG: DEAD/DEAH box helicase [Elusimicrobia bacterium]|nr:DEAD/DEAH box helicase [Elusimicrobiota bacterium]
MNITSFHGKLLAEELLQRFPSDSIEKLAFPLADAQVDLNPHQIEAALFAFRNPLSRGAILADEVGLGKTIEAGLLLSQLWAERKRRMLVILPANLRKQWSQELLDKFHLPTVILENRSFNETIAAGNLNPFLQEPIVLCSYQFARTKEAYIRQVGWDLVVVDEAHRLRNVYKPTSKIANALRNCLGPYRKVLLTATPLQNSLLELYGLVSIIDEYAFGDLKSFRSRYARLGDGADFNQLKERIKPICKRTLRKQVLEYVKYTNRFAIVQEFTPSAEEQKLYDLVSDYLQRPQLYALPTGQRQLMTLILRKLLASSTFAITNTLEGLAKKLEAAAKAAEPVQSPPDDIQDNLETVDALMDEWEESEDGEEPPAKATLSPEQLAELKNEMDLLKEFHNLAKAIIKNSKGEVLLTALRRGFEAAAKAQMEKGASNLQPKAIIFTESRRTQEYLFNILEGTEFKGKLVLFNGTNNDLRSKEIYKAWLQKHAGTDRITGSPTADMRAAIVERFRDDAAIMIATEAAAEGINLQFCNVVVNYDLPWNPQRIEQRIGRCHRYGQKFDVVVVNFLNKSNAADRRVYELLAEKFKLFNGVFGASDDVLGAVESGVDFEKRIAAIYQKCRTADQIQTEFDSLQKDLSSEIGEKQREARDNLLNNFDHEVVEKVKLQSHETLSRFGEKLWRLTRHVLAGYARFSEGEYSFTLAKNPFPDEPIHPGPYRMGKSGNDENLFRVGHPLAQRVIQKAAKAGGGIGGIKLYYTRWGRNIAALQPLMGKAGWLTCVKLTITALETEDHIVFTGQTDDGKPLENDQCRRLFDLPGDEFEVISTNGMEKALEGMVATQIKQRLETISRRDGHWFETEMDKLDKWAEDRRDALKLSLEEQDEAIKEAKRAARLAPTLPDKLELQKNLRQMESKRAEAWRAFDAGVKEIETAKDRLLDEISQRLQQRIDRQTLFTVQWEVQ